MKLFTFLLLASAWIASAQPAVAPPRIGFVVDVNQSLRPLTGFTGNLIIGDSAGEDVESAAFSASRGMVKTGSGIAVVDSQGQLLGGMEAGPGEVLFAFLPGGDAGFVLQKSSLQLLSWKEDHFDSVTLDSGLLGGEAVAIAAPDPSRVRLAVLRSDGLWLLEVPAPFSSVSGQTALPGISGSVLLNPDGTVLYADGTSLVVRQASGSERRMDAKVPLGDLRRLGDGWVQAKDLDSSQQLAIRFGSDRREVSVIPEVPCCGQ